MARLTNFPSVKNKPKGILGGKRNDLAIYWNGVNVGEWNAWFETIPRSSIEQSWGYGEAFVGMTAYVPAHGVVYRGAKSLAIVQVVECNLLGLFRIAKIIRGPLFLDDVSEDDKKTVLWLIRSRYSLLRRDFLVWTPELEANSTADRLISEIGLKKIITGYSSIWLDLGKDKDFLRRNLHQKWRNQLKNAEKQGVKISLDYGGEALEWLLTRYETHRRSHRLRVPRTPFVYAISFAMRNKQATLVFTAYFESKPIAAILIFQHGQTATYFVAWSGDEGRKRNANNLLLWYAVKELKDRKVQWLDLGGVDGSRMPGVSRFKAGLRGRLFRLAGTFM